MTAVFLGPLELQESISLASLIAGRKKELTKDQTDLDILHYSLIIDCQTRWGQVFTENYIKNS